MTTGAERLLATEHWLLAAAEDRHQAVTAWAGGGLALLRCGGTFAAARIPAARVQAAAISAEPQEIDRYLAKRLEGGPVICDRAASWYYVLVPASTARRWTVSGSTCLGIGASLGVPRPGTTAASDARVYWSVPMDSPGMLCHPAAVTGTVTAGIQGASR
ncbi:MULTISPECIES: hypothetical protein [unclassified Streptomyces]|uniref:hypothetical protein n=1 Tax=unclassified Streptomyces TaxID=2593676 RepID=UPI00378F1BF4